MVSNAQFTINKISSATYADIGDVITYTIHGINNGRADIYNLYIEDSLNPYIQFIPSSVKINELQIPEADILAGILTSKLRSSECITISYEVVITNSLYLNYEQTLDSVKYDFSLSSNEKTLQNQQEEENLARMNNTPMYNFKQISLENRLSMDSVKPDIKDINNIDSEIEVIKYYIIATPNIKSLEHQNLSGYKLIIYGLIRHKVQYTSKDNLIYSSHYNIPFSTFIVLSENYVIGSKLEVEGIVEDVYYKKMNYREYLVNTIVLVNAKILCS